MIHYFLIGLLTIVAGVALYFFPPRKRNAIYGYRSKRSFRNQESWDFANRYSAELAMKLGLVSLLIGLITYWLQTSVLVPIGIGLLLLFTIIPITEERLRKKGS